MTEIIKFITLFVGGFIASFYAATVGGMGFITLPLLILFGLPLPLAIGTNRLISLAMDITGAIKFYLHKELLLKVALVMGAIVSAGAFLGAHLLPVIPGKSLNYFTIIVLAGAFLITIFFKKNNEKIYVFKKKHIPIAILILTLLGIYGGIIGIAFGSLMILIPAMMGYTFTQSAGVARICGVMMSLAATYVFVTQNMIHYIYAIPMILGVISGSWFGISFSIKKGSRYIQTLLVIVLLASIIQLLLSS
jgi:uncharacterized membrane protein YfcA